LAEFEELTLEVNLVDNASAQLDVLKKSFAELGVGTQNLENLRRHTSELEKSMKSLVEAIGKGPEALLKFASGFGAVGIAITGAVAGIEKLTSSLTDMSKEVVDLNLLARRIGVQPAETRAMIEVYERAGRGAQAQRELAKFAETMADVQRGGAGVRKAFYDLQFEGVSKNLESFFDQIRKLPDLASQWDAIKEFARIQGEAEARRSGGRASQYEARILDIIGTPSMQVMTASMRQAVAEVDDIRRRSEARALEAGQKQLELVGKIHEKWKLIVQYMSFDIMANPLGRGLIRLDELLGKLVNATKPGGPPTVGGEPLKPPSGKPWYDPSRIWDPRDVERERQVAPQLQWPKPNLPATPPTGPTAPGMQGMPQPLMSTGGVAGFSGPYAPMTPESWKGAADWAEQLHGDYSTNVERRDLQQEENAKTRELVNQLKRANAILSGEEKPKTGSPLGLLSTQFGGLGAGYGAGGGVGGVSPMGRLPGFGGGGGGGGGGGAGIATPELPPAVSTAGIPALPGLPGGPAPGAPAAPVQPLPRVGLPGGPSGPAVRSPTHWTPGSGAVLSDEKGRPIDGQTAAAAEQLGRAGNVQGLERLFASRGYHMSGPACGIIATKYAHAAGFAGPKDSPIATRWHQFGESTTAEDINKPGRPFGSMFATYYHRRYGGDPSQVLQPGQLGGHVMTVVPGTYNEKAGTVGVVDQYGFHVRNIKDMDFRYAGDAAVKAVQERTGAPTALPAAAADGGTAARPRDWSDLHADVRRWEGFHGSTYADVGGYSIGYGTAGRPGQTITEPAARKAMEEALQQDRHEIEKINPNLSEGSKKALSSLLFNLGGDVKKLHAHGMYKAIVAGDVEAMKRVHTEFSHIHGPQGSVLPGLLRRRQEEVKYYDQAQTTVQTATPTAAEQPAQTAAPPPSIRMSSMIDLGAARRRLAALSAPSETAPSGTALSEPTIDRSVIDSIAGARMRHRAIGSANIDVNVKSEGQKSVTQTGPFRKVRLSRDTGMTKSSSGPPASSGATGESHDPSLDS
jgi:lysozyme